MSWKPLSGRIGFVASAPAASTSVSVLNLYRQAWGTDPQNYQQAPNPMMPSTAQGSNDGIAMSCILAPNRVDFNLTPHNPPGVSNEPTLKLIDDSRAFYNELQRIVGSVDTGAIQVPDGFDRAVIFVQFAAIEPDVISANKTLARTIPEKYRPDLHDEHAFALQINRPQSIEPFGEARLNFLTKWSVEQFQVITFALAGGFQGGEGQPNVLQPHYQSFLGACVSFDCSMISAPGVRIGREKQKETLVAGMRLIEDSQRDFGLDIKGFLDDKKTH